jgi:exopolysaccharide production protein ExoY
MGSPLNFIEVRKAMLVQMPRGAGDQPRMQERTQAGIQCNAFEAALRKDLASAPVISYEPMLGGWIKRSIDIALTALLAPIWLGALALAAAWTKTRTSAHVFQSQECLGYGGRAFDCFSLRLASPPIVLIDVANDREASVNRNLRWRRAIECLPRLINVLLGDMSLVGPAPLAREELDNLKAGKRYYMSARPGIIGVSSVVCADEDIASQYKAYALSWSVLTDALIMWESLGKLLEHSDGD